jgi:hypothetical protein
MHHSFSCPLCRQKMAIQSVTPGQVVVCPSCDSPIQIPNKTRPKTPRSIFERVAWVLAAFVVVVGGYFLICVFSKEQKAEAHQYPTHEVVNETPMPIADVGSQPAKSPEPSSESKKVVLTDEVKGSMLFVFAGYQKGMEWAANYGRVPTTAEYELIKLSNAPPEPASSMDQAFHKAFLDGFQTGCKEGLQQRRPAF